MSESQRQRDERKRRLARDMKQREEAEKEYERKQVSTYDYTHPILPSFFNPKRAMQARCSPPLHSMHCASDTNFRLSRRRPALREMLRPRRPTAAESWSSQQFIGASEARKAQHRKDIGMTAGGKSMTGYSGTARPKGISLAANQL